MSEEVKEAEEQEEGAEEAPKKGKLVPMLLLLVGIAGGAAGGLMVVGPALASDGGETEVAEGDDGEGSSEDGHGDEAGEGEEEGEDESILYNLPNVIVNPAGTGGSRFLVVDLSLKMNTSDAALEVEEREMEVRDVLIQLFGQQTVEQLADISAREGLKDDVAVALNELLERGRVMSLFMPRFVIQ